MREEGERWGEGEGQWGNFRRGTRKGILNFYRDSTRPLEMYGWGEDIAAGLEFDVI